TAAPPTAARPTAATAPLRGRVGGGTGADRRRARRPGPSARLALTGAAIGGAGHHPRWPDHQRGLCPARHTERNGQDPDATSQTRPQGGTGMNVQGELTWHVDPEDLTAYGRG